MKLCLSRIVAGLGLIVVLSLLPISGMIAPADAQGKKVPHYIGVRSCASICHKSNKQGQQLKIWQTSKHARAYDTLGTDKAKEIAKARGIDDPQKSGSCLQCHTTGHGVAEALKGAKFSFTEGVGCEQCHGPGSLYKKRKIMKDRQAALAKGLLLPDDKTCLQCHNAESPTYKGFEFETRWKQIAHPKRSRR